jgi:ACR3 family arsenite efflux pump ArsB
LSLAFYRKIFWCRLFKSTAIAFTATGNNFELALLLPLVFSESTAGKHLQELLDR